VRPFGFRSLEEIKGRPFSHRRRQFPRCESSGLRIRQVSRDERATSALIGDPSLGDQILECCLDRQSLDAEGARQRSRAGQRVAHARRRV
jgi:hypothetical protein